MVVEFTVGNFRSFNTPQTLSFVAGNEKKNTGALIKAGDIKLLKNIAIYGLNSGGKTNLFRALACFCRLISTSAKNNSNDSLPSEPFELNNYSKNEPTFFSIVCYINKEFYEYSFKFNNEQIIEERLEINEELLYDRKVKTVNTKDQTIESTFSKTINNTLLLSKLDQDKHERIQTLYSFLVNIKIRNTNYTNVHDFEESFNLIKNNQKDELIKYINNIYVNILDIHVEAKKLNNMELNPNAEEYLSNFLNIDDKTIINLPFSKHHIYDREGNKNGTKFFDLNKFESDGTKKLFGLLGSFLSKKNKNSMLAIDELDASLHPFQTINLIDLFNDKANKNQVIFSLHDLYPLIKSNLRKDQIYFVDKNEKEETIINSAVNFETSKKEIFKNYISGEYGAIPYILK